MRELTATIISGKEIGAAIKDDLKTKVAMLKDKSGITPGLAVVLVGDDPASRSYVRAKSRVCERLGMIEKTFELDADTPEAEVLALVEDLNEDRTYHGILVQLPLPDHIDEEKVLLAIDPKKDVDGFHPVNVGRMMIGSETFLPCTPHGIQEMLMRSENDPEGKHVVIVGRSNIVGKPLANILIQKKTGANATVTVCHSRTKDLKAMTLQADILVVAMGRPAAITADMVKSGVVVIDVGINRVEDESRKRGYRLVGDVDFEPVKEKAKAITPVPGGVGPMTVTMLMVNVFESAQKWADAAEPQ